MSATGTSLPPSLLEWQPERDESPLASGEIRVLVVNLGTGDEDEVEADPRELADWAILTAAEQARALRFVRPRDRRRFIVCRGALRRILGNLVGVSPPSVTFRTGPGGKPILAPPVVSGQPDRLHFNVSHSGELALIALGWEQELGVDVERERPITEARRIVETYFTEAEQAQFESLDGALRSHAFLRGWTRKEAVLKAIGVGLAGLARGYETMLGSEPLRSQFALVAPRACVQGWVLWEARPRDGYLAALAVRDAAGGVRGESARDTPS